ncbi:MAG: phosphatase PAP2 family protein [Nocardioides sp.]
MTAVYRRAQLLIVSIAGLMVLLALVASISLHKPPVDPDGFLGPSWLRLPLLVALALFVDIVPRTLWVSRGRPSRMQAVAVDRWGSHWTHDRRVLVLTGLLGFYLTYVSYRNLKSYLPFIVGPQYGYDFELHRVDHALFLGHDPGVVLHDLLGSGISAEVLSFVYLWFLPLVPIALTIWLIWSRNLARGYWFATSQCLAWSLGTLSYYALPTLGPGIQYAWIYKTVDDTNAAKLMGSLADGRVFLLNGSLTGSIQSVAGFASLHAAITLLFALMIQYTVRSRALRIFFWVNFGLTLVATIYFGWHYLVDDIAGIAIALVSFYVGGLVSNQDFSRHREEAAEERPREVTTV